MFLKTSVQFYVQHFVVVILIMGILEMMREGKTKDSRRELLILWSRAKRQARSQKQFPLPIFSNTDQKVDARKSSINFTVNSKAA
jgi:hypothetical protein